MVIVRQDAGLMDHWSDPAAPLLCYFTVFGRTILNTISFHSDCLMLLICVC